VSRLHVDVALRFLEADMKALLSAASVLLDDADPPAVIGVNMLSAGDVVMYVGETRGCGDSMHDGEAEGFDRWAPRPDARASRARPEEGRRPHRRRAPADPASRLRCRPARP
jgi:hypothetical protein